MKRIVALAGGEGWHVQDLHRAARSLKLEFTTTSFQSLSARLRTDEPEVEGLSGEAVRFADGDHIVVRTMPGGTLEQVVFRMDVLHRLEATGIPVTNRPSALEAAIDKYLGAARMKAAGLPVPPTITCERAARALEAYDELGGDVVVKPIFGSEGRGILRLSTRTEAEAHFREVEAAGGVFCLQLYVQHPGHDFRILTLGNKVLCGMRRLAQEGWVTNIAQGGRALPVEVTPELASLALRAAEAIGAEIAGVDILPDVDGNLWLLEVNAVPGWRALAPVSGVDVATEVLRYIVGQDGSCPEPEPEPEPAPEPEPEPER
jgi:RimK family alpha-L-glutamate ligase